MVILTISLFYPPSCLGHPVLCLQKVTPQAMPNGMPQSSPNQPMPHMQALWGCSRGAQQLHPKDKGEGCFWMMSVINLHFIMTMRGYVINLQPARALQPISGHHHHHHQYPLSQSTEERTMTNHTFSSKMKKPNQLTMTY